MFSQYGSCVLIGSKAVTSPLKQVVGVEVSGLRYASGNSPWPRLIPPESVPALLKTRLLAICRLCPQAWTKMPPPPWELSVMPNPSMLDGLHMKLLGNGLPFEELQSWLVSPVWAPPVGLTSPVSS